MKKGKRAHEGSESLNDGVTVHASLTLNYPSNHAPHKLSDLLLQSRLSVDETPMLHPKPERRRFGHLSELEQEVGQREIRYRQRHGGDGGSDEGRPELVAERRDEPSTLVLGDERGGRLRGEEGSEEEGSHAWANVGLEIEKGRRRGGAEEVNGLVEVVSN